MDTEEPSKPSANESALWVLVKIGLFIAIPTGLVIAAKMVFQP
jgi:hypothetical protein